MIPQNARAYRLRASEGRLKVTLESARAGRARLPRLVVEPDVLASLVGGAVSPVRAAEIGLLDSSGGAADIIDRWFRTRPAFVYPLNGF